ncbi:MAG: hypothetical protein GKR96_06525 [Gammaproteobacteria bacterium]|nr:hypothetical protein [Gammaproteobacteria bacterium]
MNILFQIVRFTAILGAFAMAGVTWGNQIDFKHFSDLLSKKQYSTVIEWLNEVSPEISRNPQSLALRAHTYFLSRDYERALKDTETILEIVPHDLYAQYQKSLLLFIGGDSNGAIEVCKNVIESNSPIEDTYPDYMLSDPSVFYCYHQLINIFLFQKDNNSALRYANGLISKLSNATSSWESIIRVHQNAEAFEEALTDIERARVAIKEDVTPFIIAKVRTFRLRGDIGLALSELKAFLSKNKLSPDSYDYAIAHIEMGKLWRSNGRSKRALRSFNKVISASNNFSAEAFLERGKLYQLSGKHHLARVDYMAVLDSLFPRDPVYEEAKRKLQELSLQ